MTREKVIAVYKSNDNGKSNGRSDVNGGEMTEAIVVSKAVERRW